MLKSFFITGTDTDVGKTYVAAALIRGLAERQLTVSGFKPVAAGATWQDGQFKNEDAIDLLRESTAGLGYSDVNPYCFEPAIAPHIAAEQEDMVINLPAIEAVYAKHKLAADMVIVEGAGGWMVPLNDQLGFDDLALALNAPVILVVGLKLGCINHALLTEAAILNKGCRIAGWIGNDLNGQFMEINENIRTLKQRMKSKFIGNIEYQPDKDKKSAVDQRKIKGLLDYLIEFR
ncbi:MAG: dethiobiotin synthetase [Cycloclasticus pugetii]|jgi:dethiobiotin synthetase